MTGPEVTAAVERAGEAVKETVCTAWPAYVSDRMAIRIARDGLAAALDVEEMARAEHEYGCVFGGCTSTLDQHGENVQKAYRSRAEFIRAAILGANQ